MLNPPHHKESGQSTSARKAAEALFTSKEEHRAPEPKNAVARKPRVLAAVPPATLDTASTVVSPSHAARRAIPKSQIDRVRTWLKYGMTVRQAADACGVSVSDLKDALQSRAW